MKKTVLILNLLLSSFLVFSQSLSLSNDNGPLANNGVMMVSGDMYLPLAAIVHVTNNTGSNLEVKVKKVELDIVPGSLNYFCWYLCYPPNVYVSPDTLVIPANGTVSDFSGDYDAMGMMGISKIRYVFFKNHVPDDSVCVEVWFNAGYVGINETLPVGIKFSSAYPNPASSVVHFDYSFPSNTSFTSILRISNILGETVKEMQLLNSQGKLDIPVHELNDGLYFYSLFVNGSAIVTRKLVVR